MGQSFPINFQLVVFHLQREREPKLPPFHCPHFRVLGQWFESSSKKILGVRDLQREREPKLSPFHCPHFRVLGQWFESSSKKILGVRDLQGESRSFLFSIAHALESQNSGQSQQTKNLGCSRLPDFSSMFFKKWILI